MINHYRVVQQLRELQSVQQLDKARQREMREVILDQQQEVKGLSQEVEDIQRKWEEVERVNQEIRDIIGVDKFVPTPTPTPKPMSMGGAALGGSGAHPTLDMGGKVVAIPTSQPSMLLVTEVRERIQELRDLLPAKLREQLYLYGQVTKRVAKIEPAKRRDPLELQRQLKLLAAGPKLWPVEGRITSYFGSREFEGRDDFHTGIDIGVWYYTEVRATKDGVVTWAGWRQGYGWVVEIEHEMGYSTLYAHNVRYTVDPGDEVKAGDIIAYVGSTGNTTGPHLHYEIRLNGQPLNPMKFLELSEP
ncbi:MAG: M23 family metallopeptidase [Anaerolineae bacterium]